jgi:hypothetical protein
MFLCLWTGLMARLKGYSAVCWLFGGGVVGLVLLCRLPVAGPGDWARKARGNRLGLVLSLLWLPVLWLAFHFSKSA